MFSSSGRKRQVAASSSSKEIIEGRYIYLARARPV
jgi:hypothetical protein